ncbi:MAG: tail fiber domain-containing protein [Bacteroidales bacterium]|nr:tail fiber domain-containing protein [Bacteroidales bacterium]MCF8389696.1 tail fiber domain-containing protein [Bacteroidales bacterium]
MKQLIYILMLAAFTFMANAQIKVASNNSIGIGTENPISKLSVGSDGDTYNKVYIRNDNTAANQKGMTVVQAPSISGNQRGILTAISQGSGGAKLFGIYSSSIRSTPESNGRTYGIWGAGGNATTGYNHGVYGELSGSNYGAAIFGATPGKGETYINNIYAGYFRGKVFIEDRVGIMTTTPDAAYALTVNGAIKCNGFLDISSDERLKTDINVIPKGALSNIASLRGVTYKLKEPDMQSILSSEVASSDTSNINASVIYDNQIIYDRQQTGFIAQEVQLVFPDLVTTADDGSLSINYIGLIPNLVEAIKEQQVQIDALEKIIEDLLKN